MDPDPHESQNSGAIEAQNGAVDDQNGGVEAQNGGLGGRRPVVADSHHLDEWQVTENVCLCNVRKKISVKKLTLNQFQRINVMKRKVL